MGTRLLGHRPGAVAVFALCLMIVLLAMVALAIDIGYLLYVNTELQRTADAAALAATWRLLDEKDSAGPLNSEALSSIRSTGSLYAGYNAVANNPVGLTCEDVTVGRLSYPFSSASAMDLSDPAKFNAVTVRVRKTGEINGSVGLFFARVLGIAACDMQREATAAFLDSFAGFRAVSEEHMLDLLPFALDRDTWNALLAGVGTDEYTWDPEDKCVRSGPDGILEANLYPQGTGSPGNRGTVDIGSSNNSTADICRQIRHGVSAADLAYHGGKLELDAAGKLYLNGDTGISAGVKDDLASIIGRPRIIPVFSQVTGPGNNAQYTIVQFAGIRIMHVKLTGSPSSKKVLIQPAKVTTRGAIPSPTGSPTSDFIYSPVWLVR